MASWAGKRAYFPLCQVEEERAIGEGRVEDASVWCLRSLARSLMSSGQTSTSITPAHSKIQEQCAHSLAAYEAEKSASIPSSGNRAASGAPVYGKGGDVAVPDHLSVQVTELVSVWESWKERWAADMRATASLPSYQRPSPIQLPYAHPGANTGHSAIPGPAGAAGHSASSSGIVPAQGKRVGAVQPQPPPRPNLLQPQQPTQSSSNAVPRLQPCPPNRVPQQPRQTSPPVDDQDMDEDKPHERQLDFISATEKLQQDESKKGNNQAAAAKKSLGGKRRGGFINPEKRKDEESQPSGGGQQPPPAKKAKVEQTQKAKGEDGEELPGITDVNGVPLDDPRLRNIDPTLLERVLNEVMDHSPGIHWTDIAGLEFAKRCVHEAVVWPMLRPDIFFGLRGPPKGLLLFGPPGTGKTMIGKAIATESMSTFFNISAATLTSKWIGEGEKTVRALFAVARCFDRSVIFIDEIDSILTQRSETENEASRRLKTEFLIQLDGAGVMEDGRILVVGATNRPQELDEAARRRLVKRLYIALPDDAARVAMVRNLLKSVSHCLTEEDLKVLTAKTEGYSGSDIKALCSDAALGPIRSLQEEKHDISMVDVGLVRPVSLSDFIAALSHVRASVSKKDLTVLYDWNANFGSYPISDQPSASPSPMEHT